MIVQFPQIYEDELVYSLFARYRLQYINYVDAANNLYVNKRCRPNIEFVNKIRPEIQERILEDISMDTLIEKHTMYPYYGRFINKDRRKDALTSLRLMDGNYCNLLPLIKMKQNRYARYCPKCAKEDREKLGETYWHRNHQVIGVNVCTKHRCYLENSDVIISGKSTPNLITAENVIPYQENLNASTNKMELQLADYIIEVFQSPMNIDAEATISQFLNAKLNEKYLSASGLMRDVTKLYKNYDEYYSDIEEKMNITQLQKIINGYQFQCYEICQLAMFLGIPSNELVQMELPKDKIVKDTLYKNVAERLNMDYDIIQTIGQEVIKEYLKNQRVTKKSTNRSFRWNRIDEELLPKVKSVVKELYDNGGDRPHRVTVNAVQKVMNLPERRFDNLPLCKAEINRYKEDQEHYWAREVIWAVKQITEKNRLVSWKAVRVLINIRPVNYDACLKYIDGMADDDIKDIVYNLRNR